MALNIGLDFTQSDKISQSAVVAALNIIKEMFGYDFTSCHGSALDLKYNVDFDSDHFKIAWRHLSSKYGHEPTMKIKSQNNQGIEQNTEYQKIINGESRADYILYSFFDDDSSKIVSWMIVDAEILSKYLKRYSSLKLTGQKTESHKWYKFIKIRPIFLRLIKAVDSEHGIIDSPSYGNQNFDGGEKELEFFKEFLDISDCV